jgi:integrase
MATTKCKLSAKIGEDGKQQIKCRLTINRTDRPQFNSGVYVLAKYFNTIKGEVVPPKKGKLNLLEVDDAEKAKTDLNHFTNRLIKICQVTEKDNKDKLTKEFIEDAIRVLSNIPDDEITYKCITDKLQKENEDNIKAKREKSRKTFFAYMDEYIIKSQFSYDYTKGMKVLMRILARYEGYQRMTDNKNYHLDIDKLTRTDIEDIRDYIRDEYSLSIEYPKIFDKLLKDYPVEITVKHISPKLVKRGDNAIIKLMKKFKAFYNWMNDNEYTINHPFEGVKVGTEHFGTPYYITLDERNIIADYDLSEYPSLSKQRDVFIFQCLIGCRVGDLMRMTNSNIVNGEVAYIPNKTKDEKPITVSVPLNKRAMAILDRYHKEGINEPILPFISAQKYNKAIKDIFTICGITRIVTILNPTNGEEEQRPINEVASSHMARRTFIGNLYKQVQDPNMIGKLSGHTEGSKAFSRYRDIDKEMKVSMVELLE